MSDAEFEYMNCTYYGDYLDNPWHDSVLGKHIPEDIEEEILEDLTSITDEEKLLAPDLDIDLLME